MNECRYKSFISYSHQDESWARWLHRALEGYRLPSGLVGQPGPAGPVPKRFAPVFRDRDELTSSHDLSSQVREALEQSASLIVVCSPAAAASHWVNEEIRHFRELGRGDRVFCLIVAGDPQATDTAERCFPPALLESDSGQEIEPLAADARRWADGKPLARLKLIAGILGVRLDELRRRDLQRRRRTRIAYAIAAVAAVTLLLFTVLSQVSERRQRERSEELAGFVVDLSSGLESVASLETLGTIGARMYDYLGSLDEDHLTPETRKQIALVLRQLGEVNRLRGQVDEARQALQRSLGIIADLSRDNPGDSGLLYELGNAEFYVGNSYFEGGNFTRAIEYFNRYQEVAAELVRREPDNPQWVMELSYSHTNLAGVMSLSDQGGQEALLMHIEEAQSLAEQTMALAPDNEAYRGEYAKTLGWAADSQLSVCNLGGALVSRLKSVELASEMSSQRPGDNGLKKDLAYAQSGLGSIQRQLGLIPASLATHGAARDLLQALSDFDPENLDYRWEALYRSALIGDLHAEADDLETAQSVMSSLRAPMEALLESEGQHNPRIQSQFAQYLLDYAELEWRSGAQPESRQARQAAEAQLARLVEDNPGDRISLQRLFKARFFAWSVGDETPGLALSTAEELFPDGEEHATSCELADIAARRAILSEDRAMADHWVAFLLTRGYFEGGFVRFCRSYGLCEG